MVVEFDKSFLRYLKKIKDKPLLEKIDGIITEIEESSSRALQNTSGTKQSFAP